MVPKKSRPLRRQGRSESGYGLPLERFAAESWHPESSPGTNCVDHSLVNRSKMVRRRGQPNRSQFGRGIDVFQAAPPSISPAPLLRFPKIVLNRRPSKTDINLAAPQRLDLMPAVNVFQVELDLG